MLGEILYQAGGDGRPHRTERWGLPVWQVQVRPGGWREKGRLRAAARRLARHGVRRALAPPEFAHWALLREQGLRPVDPVPFLRFYAGELALAALARRGVPPRLGAVALRGRRADRDMVRAAEFLCPRVRALAISAPQGGAELADWLRREYGVPVCPDGPEAGAAVCFDGAASAGGDWELILDGVPRLAGLRPRAADLGVEGENLPLLAALWETGRLNGLEFA